MSKHAYRWCLYAIRRSQSVHGRAWSPLSTTSGTNGLWRVSPSTATVRHSHGHQSSQPEDILGTVGTLASKPRADGTDSARLLLQPDNLFHPLSKSPIPNMRERGDYMRAHAFCSHPSHNRHRQLTSKGDPETRKPLTGGFPAAHVSFECPYCGIPVSCSEEHWAADYEEHMHYCDILREANEDDHDLRSGRSFAKDFYLPIPDFEECLTNFTNWDTFFYTRSFDSLNNERSMRHLTKMLTYPITVASVVHELSPYNIRKDGRMTPEGLRSFTALRYNLHPPKTGIHTTVKTLKPAPPPVRVFVLGARAESSLPRQIWLQLASLFHDIQFHVIMIGPESMMNRHAEFPMPERTPRNPFGAVVEADLSVWLKVSTYVEYYQTLHEARHFVPYDPYFDCFVLFQPGLGHPVASREWEGTVPQLLETKCPIIVTGYTQLDMERDVDWVQEKYGSEMDMLLEPGENRFRSLKWDINDLDPHDITAGNWGVWAFRGKRYEAQTREISE